MSYDMHAHQNLVRGGLLRLLADGGSGWQDYVQAEATRFDKEDPTLHRGLLQAVQDAIAAQRQTRTRRS